MCRAALAIVHIIITTAANLCVLGTLKSEIITCVVLSTIHTDVP